jgi:CRISPR-associated protein Cas2
MEWRAGSVRPGTLPLMARNWHLVAYDVRDDVRLRRVAKLLEGYGERVQYSVFRCRLSERTRSELLWRLAKVMDPEDALLLVPLCGECRSRIVERSVFRDWQGPAPTFRIL